MPVLPGSVRTKKIPDQEKLIRDVPNYPKISIIVSVHDTMISSLRQVF